MARFHGLHPGVMRRAFARGRDVEGRSSYQLLAEHAAPGQRVLELGCGDGHLVTLAQQRGAQALGVELARAEVLRAGAGGARVVVADAARLPLAPASMDLVLSHLALSVMAELDAVCDEVDRVLAPGGRLVALLGGGPALREPPEGFDVLLALFDERLRGRARAALGDRRAADPERFCALWQARGYRVRWQRHELDFGGSVGEVWASLAACYDVVRLTPHEARALAAAFARECARHFGERVPATMVTFLALAEKPAGAEGASHASIGERRLASGG